MFWVPALLLLLPSCAEKEKTRTLFTLQKDADISFVNEVKNTTDYNIFSYRNFYNGGGVAIGDINNDGLSDVFFTSNMGANKLYINKGNWRFEDISAKAGEFFTPPEVVDTLVRMLEPHEGDTIYDPTGGSGGMIVHCADYLREQGNHATACQYFMQEMNWGNAAIGKINSVLHGLEAKIEAGASTISDPAHKEADGTVKKFSLVLANFPFSDEMWCVLVQRECPKVVRELSYSADGFGLG